MVNYDVVELTGTTDGAGAATVQSKAENISGEIVGVITDGSLLTASWDLTLTAQAKDVAGTWVNVETIIGVSGAELARGLSTRPSPWSPEPPSRRLPSRMRDSRRYSRTPATRWRSPSKC